MKHTPAILLLLILQIAACSRNKEEQSIDTGADYFPLKVGMERVFSIDSLAYDNNAGFTQIDTFRYFYKEQILEQTTNDAGEQIWILSRWFADSLQGPWQQANRWQIIKNEWHAIIIEENRPFLRLAFPLELNKNWNGNLFNNLGLQRYRVVSINQAFGQYNNTLLVQEISISNAIEEIRRNLRYAHLLGMVQLVHDSLNTQISGTRGFRKLQTLIEAR
jgi:hypothetical protein